MIVLPTILLFFLIHPCFSIPRRDSCPQIPSTCQCEPEPSGKLVVTCNGVDLNSLFKDLGTLPLERLSVVNCSHPVLDILPRGPVRSLEISGCGIQSVDNKVFQGVADSLEELILANNSLKAVPLLGSLRKLVSLNLNGNKLCTVDPMAIMNVSHLQFLYLKENVLSALDGTNLQILHQLEVLDVRNNLLSKIPILKDFPNLRQVLLDGNLIDKIETLTFSNNPRLMDISLQNNNITQISSNSFESLNRMTILRLNHNSITSLGHGALEGMPNLVELYLKNNSLVEVDLMTVIAVPHLAVLDLAYNKIEKIKKKTFFYLSQLVWLNLSNNNLHGFEQDTFNKNTANILLDGNQWECDEKFDWFVTFLTANNVETFLRPFQKEISCAGPEKYAGVQLKDLMMTKANNTIAKGMKTLEVDKQSKQK